MLTIGSLFSGIGGLELGLERAGLGPVRWQVEIEPFCRQVLKEHWPDSVRYNDVRNFQYESWGQFVDVICGGFPCTDISVAGKGEGIEGEQSSLWREFKRIVGLVLPRYVVVENVSALLSRGMGVVLGDLATLGYDAEWDCIPAQAVGAPHRRDRIFIIARRVLDADSQRRRTQQEPWPGGYSPHIAHLRAAMADRNSRGLESKWGSGVLDGQRSASGDHVDGRGGEKLADTTGPRLQGRGDSEEPRSSHGQSSHPSEPWPPAPEDMHAWGAVQEDSQPSICRVANGIPNRAHRLRALGNAVVPQVAEVIGRRIVELEQAHG